MALQSTLFRGDPQLDAAAVSDPAHIVAGAKGPHVVKIQQALIQLDGAAITADGAYGQGTATAVSAFKQKRQILNFQGKIDNIVGKKTIAALDSEMIAKEQGGGGIRPRLAFGLSVQFVDIVVRFRGGAFRSATDNLDLVEHKKKSERRLFAISKGANVGDTGLINSVVAEIDKELSDPLSKLGIICINGNSAGGRNALELAAALKGKRPIKFLGISDAALFPDLPGLNTPIPSESSPSLRGTARNIPIWGSPPAVDAEIKQNFFQNADNNWSRFNRNARFEWTGKLTDFRREIHGRLQGFDKNGGEEILVPLSELAQFKAHVFAGDDGDRRNGVTISKLLGSL